VLRPATPKQLEEIQKYLDSLEDKQRNKLQQMDPALRSATLQQNDALSSKVAPLGALGLPPLLEQRRLEYGIIDACFEAQPAFDRVYVVQISTHEDEKIGNIIMPQMAQDREKGESPRGILIAAGLRAMDHLRSNGIQLGDIVRFIDMAPFRFIADTVEGHEINVMILNDGDILDSLDTKRRVKEGKMRIACGFNKDGTFTHFWESLDDEQVGTPQQPAVPEIA
jgi:co-chaperonin GroES (HSP10)